MGAQPCMRTLEAKGLIFLVFGSQTTEDVNTELSRPQGINTYTAESEHRLWSLRESIASFIQVQQGQRGAVEQTHLLLMCVHMYADISSHHPNSEQSQASHISHILSPGQGWESRPRRKGECEKVSLNLANLHLPETHPYIHLHC